MGDHHEAAVAACQEALQPLARRQIQVVGGLVEEQQVGAAQQHPAQRDAHLPAAGQLADRPVAVRFLEPQAAHDDADLAVALVVAAALQPFEELPVRGEHLLAIVSVGHAPLQRRGLGRHRVQVGEGALQLLDDRPAEPGRMVAGTWVAGPGLRQVAHPRAALQAHAAGVRGVQACGHAQQRALAAAVGAGQRDTVSPGQRGACAGEHGLRAVGDADPFQGDGSHVSSRSGSRSPAAGPPCPAPGAALRRHRPPEPCGSPLRHARRRSRPRPAGRLRRRDRTPW